MRYTVTFLPVARNQLTEIWLASSDRRAVTAAANRIEQLLRASPESQGEDYYGDRIMEEGPLVVTFKISPDDRLVEVSGVWPM